ncbi:TAXI family TRAP transporter solute-binding subunit [Nocardia panacis]|uniref:TAXI family TRAP transporter solute-binding subunit n=1 Tax=Nocardia panacis TaxID=2340916 RepID=A0A3A4K8C0_9NOCA|nr:TAXI family TRAP transporter solute-binding subunit [Nocardia panacis]RJO73812.1 TAXI family TRAP transporter solute-binding subunit [Nocardia panacis]
MTRVARGLAAATVLAGLVTGCGANESDTGGCAVREPVRLAIATGNATGVYHALGGALAEQLAQGTEGKVRATAAETVGSPQNIQQLVSGTAQLAFSQSDTAADAALGKGVFEGNSQPVRALSRLYLSYAHVIVRADAKIDSLADMRGRRVSTGGAQSGTEMIAQRMLRAAGLNPDADIQAQHWDLGRTVDGMREGTLDAMFFIGGLPTPGVTELLASAHDKVRLIDVTDVLPGLRAMSTSYEGGAIPASVYATASDTRAVVVPNVLLVREDMDPDLACVVTRTLFDRKPQLEQANSAAKGILRGIAPDTDPVALHRGAARVIR